MAIDYTSDDGVVVSTATGTTSQTAANLCDAIEAVTADTTANAALRFLNLAYQRFLSGMHPDPDKPAHSWSFLRGLQEISIGGAVTGTATGTTAGKITATTAIFNPGMVRGTITISDTATRTATVTSYESPTIIHTDDTAGFTSKSISVDRTGVTSLPADFGGSLTRLVFAPDTGSYSNELARVDIKDILQEWSPYPVEGRPRRYAVIASTFSSSAEQRWELAYSPVPDEAIILIADYPIEPAELTDAAVYPVGGPKHHPTLLAMALAEWERVSGRVPGYWTNEAMRLMAMSINADKRLYSGQYNHRTALDTLPLAGDISHSTSGEPYLVYPISEA